MTSMFQSTAEQSQESRDKDNINFINNRIRVVQMEPLNRELQTYDEFPRSKIAVLKDKIENAKRNHETFSTKGLFQTVKNELLKRGWIEKYELPNFQRVPPMANPNKPSLSVDELARMLPPRGDESVMIYHMKCERLIRNKLLEDHVVDFYWGIRRDGQALSSPYCTIIRNRLPYVPFTSKVGLNIALEELRWVYQINVADTWAPRCYNIADIEELNAFVADFRMTACTNLLRFLVDSVSTRGEGCVIKAGGNVPLSTIQFAIRRCDEYMLSCLNEDLDKPFKIVDPIDWASFLKKQEALLYEHGMLCADQNVSFIDLVLNAKRVMSNIKLYRHDLSIDGTKNLWIMKPGNSCRGRGIIIVSDTSQVYSNLCLKKNTPRIKYIVQKYIERPLLIYRTKFDIRQWFLVASVQPMIIWMYRDCYLRFSSQIFDLDNLHESVHLTNHAIQKKYHNVDRTMALPPDNMWDSNMFQSYLQNCGKGSAWNSIIYPGMRKGIVGAMLASQDKLVLESRSFELFGADFMVDENFNPWLIEINSNPDMSYSTKTTARLCVQCVEDLIKVIVDARKDPKCDKGKFERIFMDKYTILPKIPDPRLKIEGYSLLTIDNTYDKDIKQTTEATTPPQPPANNTETVKPTVKQPVKVPDKLPELNIDQWTLNKNFKLVKRPDNVEVTTGNKNTFVESQKGVDYEQMKTNILKNVKFTENVNTPNVLNTLGVHTKVINYTALEDVKKDASKSIIMQNAYTFDRAVKDAESNNNQESSGKTMDVKGKVRAMSYDPQSSTSKKNNNASEDTQSLGQSTDENKRKMHHHIRHVHNVHNTTQYTSDSNADVQRVSNSASKKKLQRVISMKKRRKKRQ